MRSLTLLLVALMCAATPIACHAADRLSVILDWFVNADHEQILAADYCGAFARHGLQVTLIAPADTSSPPRLVAAGQADLAISYQTELAFMAARGLPVVRVGTLMDQPLNVLMTLPGTGIHSLADLKGRRVGVSVGPGDEAMLNGMLASAGLAPGDIVRTDVNFQIEQALMTHRVDAVLGMRNYEMIDLQQKGLQPVAFRPEQHGVPPYDELIVVARRDHAGDPKIARFLAALKDGTACLLHDPDAVWQQTIRARPELDTKLNKAAWWASLAALARDPAHLDRERYEAFQQFLVSRGALRDPAPVASYVR
ncbi:ABC transporter substrate-binding protein [Lichenicoccus sp.]|uniref:ABC transporter substrate-binding protein n=1 Tax=Lichenicoccus sp. TaxID=2781899 RepID=UPI003D15311C